MMYTTISCAYCGAESIKRTKEVTQALKNGRNLYCNSACASAGYKSGKKRPAPVIPTVDLPTNADGSPIDWRPLPDTNGRYMLSPDCQVFSMKHRRLLKIVINSNGYPVANIRSSNDAKKAKMVLLHSAMLEAFVSPRPEGMVCRHLNGNRSDNRLDNLAWGTPSENIADMRSHGRSNRRQKNISLRDILEIYQSKERTPLLAKQFGVSLTTVRRIRHGHHPIAREMKAESLRMVNDAEEVEKMREEITSLRDQLAEAKAEIKRLKARLELHAYVLVAQHKGDKS